GSYPERSLVEQTYAALQKNADERGFVDAEPEDIARTIKSNVNGREVEGAIKILARGGALTTSNGERARVVVRLLATPERIKRELTGEANSELGLLRSLWRAVGTSLSTGVVIDLDGLPPGIGGSTVCTPLLESLQKKQFLVWERAGAGLYLGDRNAPLSRFEIDWTSLDRRRRAEMSKLQAVQSYAYTKQCRRGFVLRYFGDPAARAHCDGCDNCLGVAAPRVTRGEDALLTRKAKRVRPATEGAALGRRRPSANSLTRSDPIDEAPLGDNEQRLLASLKAVRTAIAREEHVPPYIVFSDRTLAELAVRRPRSLRAFQEVRGVGPTKLERYGERFLDAISKADDIEAA
ncbi:MAG TPA: HRDC domain-containing protein, partial [Gemmatimonadaceae bacterium]